MDRQRLKCTFCFMVLQQHLYCIHYNGFLLSTEHTVDGRNPANQLRFVGYPIIYEVLYIPGGDGVLPSTVCFFPNCCPNELQLFCW